MLLILSVSVGTRESFVRDSGTRECCSCSGSVSVLFVTVLRVSDLFVTVARVNVFSCSGSVSVLFVIVVREDQSFTSSYFSSSSWAPSNASQSA